MSIDVCPLDIGMHDRALALSERHGFHIYDALIVAAALEADADAVRRRHAPRPGHRQSLRSEPVRPQLTKPLTPSPTPATAPATGARAAPPSAAPSRSRGRRARTGASPPARPPLAARRAARWCWRPAPSRRPAAWARKQGGVVFVTCRSGECSATKLSVGCSPISLARDPHVRDRSGPSTPPDRSARRSSGRASSAVGGVDRRVDPPRVPHRQVGAQVPARREPHRADPRRIDAVILRPRADQPHRALRVGQRRVGRIAPALGRQAIEQHERGDPALGQPRGDLIALPCRSPRAHSRRRG